METSRQKLGEVIKFAIRERGTHLPRVANRLKCSLTDLQAICDGRRIPTSDQWRALCEGINRRLTGYQKLYLEARSEGDLELSSIVTSLPNSKLTSDVKTNLGDKMRNVIVLPSVKLNSADSPPKLQSVPVILSQTSSNNDTGKDIATDSKPSPRTSVAGSRSHEAREERINYAKGLLLQRPHIKIQGRDGLKEAIRQRFGVSLSWEILNKIKCAFDAEMRVSKSSSITVNPVVEVAVKPVGVAAGQVSAPYGEAKVKDTLNQVIDLLLSEIPNLQNLSVKVSESGEASIEYSVREVKISTMSGSLTVKRNV